MQQATTIVIETTGGAPVFHIPFPISTLNSLGSGGAASENVKFVFRNSGGTPTFHVGGAAVGVSLTEAWDYATVARAVMQRVKTKGEPSSAVAPDGVQIKIEEETPRMLMKDKRMSREPEAEANEQRGSEAAIDITDLTTPRRPSRCVAVRQYSREESDALKRGSLTVETFDDAYKEGRQDFAYFCDPSKPLNRTLSVTEENEWRLLWEALLRLDRLFSGPLRNLEALKQRTDEMMVDAAQRVHEKQQKRVSTAAESHNHQCSSKPLAGAEQDRDRNDESADEVVEIARLALRPLRQEILARSQDSAASANAPVLDVSARKRDKMNGTVTSARDSRAPTATATAWLKGTGGAPRVLRNVKENAAHPRLDSTAATAGKKRARATVDMGDAPEKRPKRDPMQTPTPATRSAAAAQNAATSTKAPRPVVDYYHKTKTAYTPEAEAYTAWIPDPRASTSASDPGTLTPAERAWLAAQGDLVRAPDHWRPVRWLALGARMYHAATTHPGVRPLHHSVLLATWDRGEWRFSGHEHVGQVGTPWAAWIQSKEGRRWRTSRK
ncbi:hypothetical protein GGX14DRAFT_671520 [Mycena pura]|uniref:Uncharacterized protein n=1 Tax=Mycena pura TaxID=153505 RepID=A0AAD6V1A1_9AGAR|nr:hypothetical protein GGX14DRAFT_671520 [Mycena pura]